MDNLKNKIITISFLLSLLSYGFMFPQNSENKEAITIIGALTEIADLKYQDLGGLGGEYKKGNKHLAYVAGSSDFLIAGVDGRNNV